MAEAAAVSDLCEMKTPDCQGKMTGMQHKKRRGKYYLVREKMIRACNGCQLWAELHPHDAVAMGISEWVHVKD